MEARCLHATRRVFTLLTCGRFLTSASKFTIKHNGVIFDVSPENDRALPL